MQNYKALDTQSVIAYFKEHPVISEKLGGESSSWTASEVGDGNLNLVFIIHGPIGKIIVKQALPYLRIIGEGYPLTIKRSYFEHKALLEETKVASEFLPKIYDYNQDLALIAMEFLEPHIIMRKGLIRGTLYPSFAKDIASFMSKTLFFTSDLALPADKKKSLIQVFSDNTELCKITEDLIFTHPYITDDGNRWTTPQLDDIVQFIQTNGEIKIAISELKRKFLTSAEALLHGDLHTGSILITETDTRVIDPEFAFCGPMGFDIGAVFANLFLAYYSQEGHETSSDSRDDYRNWILKQIEDTWTQFSSSFIHLWNTEHNGDLYPNSFFQNESPEKSSVQDTYMKNLFSDSVGFAAAKMIRRILGLAHTEDLESIENPDLRAVCERKALHLAIEMLTNRSHFSTMKDCTNAARTTYEKAYATT